MDRYPATDDQQPEIELWDPDDFERTSSASTSSAGRGIVSGHIGGRIARSAPAAIAGSLLVAAVAFGAVIRPALTSSDSPAGGKGDGGKITLTDHGKGYDAGDKPADGAVDGDKVKYDGAGKPSGDKPADGANPGGDKPANGDKPAGGDEPVDEPGSDQAAKPLDLALHLADGYVKVDWSGCDVDGFRYFKVVRSTDEHATWPLGAGDKLVAAIEDPATTVAADADLKAGKTLHYRVVALAGDDLGVACASPVRVVAIPAADKPDPEDNPEPKPDDPSSGAIGLSLSVKDGQVYVDWAECGVDFDYAKVVRSTDSKVTWPKGDGDSMVAAVGPDGKTAAWDGDAPAGKKAWYRVFCVVETEGGYKVVASSAAKAVAVPGKEQAPEPKPVALGFEVDVTDGGVALHWEKCTSDVFVAYKVVRSHGKNPSYLPGTDGSQVIGVIENQGTNSLVDGDVEAGQTWYYRVQAIGYMNGHKILLGQTAAIAVTVE